MPKWRKFKWDESFIALPDSALSRRPVAVFCAAAKLLRADADAAEIPAVTLDAEGCRAARPDSFSRLIYRER